MPIKLTDLIAHSPEVVGLGCWKYADGKKEQYQGSSGAY
jgi:hypothetical protein